jgi:formiminotetrahydrofolate cyclodeaminase
MTATEFATPSAARYTDLLAAATSTPGGGSASAVAGALAASLVEMVLGISAEKRVETAASPELAQARQHRARLLALGAEDEAAYGGYMNALRLPKTTDDEKAARKQALETATITAANVPLAIAGECLELLRLIIPATPQSLPALRSDLETAAHLAHGAANGALVMVDVNLSGLKNPEAKTPLSATYDALQRDLSAALVTALAAISAD